MLPFKPVQFPDLIHYVAIQMSAPTQYLFLWRGQEHVLVSGSSFFGQDGLCQHKLLASQI